MVKRPEKLLATVLLSNNLVNTAAASLGTALALSLITDETVAVLVATAAVTLLLLIFSESLPKTIAWNRSETVGFCLCPSPFDCCDCLVAADSGPAGYYLPIYQVAAG